MTFQTIIASFFLLPRPRLQRFLWGLIRKYSPAYKLGNRVFVSRYEDVLEVFNRDEDFTVSEIYAKRMADVHLQFFLGMDKTKERDRDVSLMQKVIKREDLPFIQDFVRNKSKELIEQANNKGQIDIVNEYARVVSVHLVQEYFGIPVESEEKVKHWMRILFHHIFLNPLNDEKLKEEAVRAGDDLKAYIEKIISERKENLLYTGDLKDNVLNRLLLLQQSENWITDDIIRRNICGFIVGAVETTSKATALIMDVLLDKPKELEISKELASKNAIPALSKMMLEALRFKPHNAVVARYCKKETHINKNKALKIPAGSTVYVGTMSAMFDPSYFTNPNEINLDRKAEYFHFSAGVHSCSGKYINMVQIPELMAGLLRLKNLTRSAENKGKILYEGPFPERFILRFSPFDDSKEDKEKKGEKNLSVLTDC